MTKYVEIDAYIHFDSSRQTIKNSNTTLELLEIKKMKHSYKNLKEVPAVQNYDVCTNLVIGMNEVLEITNPIMDTGCIKPIISSM